MFGGVPYEYVSVTLNWLSEFSNFAQVFDSGIDQEEGHPHPVARIIATIEIQ